MAQGEGTPPLPLVKIFLRYSRKDDEVLGLVGPLKKLLVGVGKTYLGRDVEVFLDRDDIALGEDWRASLEAAIRSAWFFLPIYSGRYTESQACRDEFNQFKESSDRLGVGKLIIPAVALGIASIPEDSGDPISDYFRRHQTISLHEAWVAGPHSREHRSAVMALLDKIREHGPVVERALAEAEQSEAKATGEKSARRPHPHRQQARMRTMKTFWAWPRKSRTS